ncbi:transglutaminase family protein [Clostridium sp. CF012]|uniref:transglutaminase-like domain-containing protein n=1 Tax=Clostridium sp. CF012 TaxID=2843319 RepID=UPI001C0C2232|nr:transglutaminase-like domain-containing protein [Clostridium sp. CF012]MBU3143447.1 hypothetical protein [Clostridium sp. CF012]
MNKKISKTLLILAITLILALGRLSATFGVTVPILDSLETYRLVTTFEITNIKNGDSGDFLNTKAIIMLGSDLDSPYMLNVSAFKSSEGIITKDANGAYILTGVISRTAPNSSHNIIIERTFTTGTIDYNIDKSTITSDYTKLFNYTNYLKEEISIEVNDARIQAKAKSLTENITNPYDKAFAIFRFVNSSMNYNISSQYANKGALSALTYKQGVCEEYSKLFVALCRASGIPSRTVSGYRNQNTGINTTIDLTNIRHMWAEVYLPNYGWIIAEPTGASVSDDALVNLFGKALNPAEHIATGYKAANYNDGATFSSNYDRTKTSPPIMITNFNATLYVIDRKAISNAINAVVKVEGSNLQADIDSAIILVSALPNSIDKSDLNIRLNVVQQTIDRATIANNAIFTATTTVVKAESSNLQAYIDLAKILVNALPNGLAKTNLNARLDTVQNIIIVEYQKISKATSLTAAAYLLPSGENYNKALAAVSDLESGAIKTSLETKLVSILKTVENNKARSKFPTLLDSPFLATENTGKTWDIKLNQAIDEKTATTNNISMKNSRGQLVDFRVTCNDKVITIIPIKKFEIGEQYVVYISEKVLSTSGKGIKNGYYFTFEVN